MTSGQMCSWVTCKHATSKKEMEKYIYKYEGYGKKKNWMQVDSCGEMHV